MSRLLELMRRIRFALFRDRLSAELEDEMRLHIELRAGRLRERGLTPAVAHHEARRRFGRSIEIGEQSRDAWGARWLEHAAADVRFAARRLRRRPGFAVAAIVVAALGIGASTAVFSALDAALIRPLPFARPSELITLTDVSIPFDVGGPKRRNGPHALDIMDAAAMHDLFSSVGAYASGGLNVVDRDRPLRARVGVVTPSFFTALGVKPEAGRVFAAEEGRPRGVHTAILSDAFWRTKFGGDDVLGRSIDLSGTSYRIVGVMEPGFNFPNESDLWIPLTVPVTFETFAPFRGFIPSTVFGRLAPGVAPAAAAARLGERWTQLAGPRDASGVFDTMLGEVRSKGAAVPLRRELIGNGQRALVILMGATVLLLLVACTNLANLLLSDGASRGREVALRGVLGATRGRITRMLLVESACLAGAGATLGLLIAPALLGVLRAMIPASLAGVAPAMVNERVVLFAAILAAVTGILFGLWPALSTARVDAHEAMKAGANGGATGHGMGSTRRLLITVELALSVMLLVGSGLMLRSLHRFMSQSLGLNPNHVGTLQIALPPMTPTQERVRKLHAILDRVLADPAIEAAGAINDVPLGGQGGISITIEVDGAATAASWRDAKFARYLMATPGYFQALGIPVLQGRTFDDGLDARSPRVAVINAAMARQWWPNVNPVGRTFRFRGDTLGITVVGVIADVRERSLADTVAPQMYLPMEQQTPDHAAIVARSSLPSSVLLSRLTDAVRAADRTQAVYDVRSMDDIVSTSVAPRRTNTMLIAIFAGVAVILSAFGMYAVVSYGVTQRAREFGIRAALGATGTQLAALVGREMAWVVALGIALGLGGAWIVSRVMSSLLFGVTVHDVGTFVAVPLVLIVPVVVATVVPARRAMRASPMDVIRAD